MQLLLSMTNASPAIKLILLTWVTKLGDQFQHGELDALAKALGVSKRHLVQALDYLVQEGYLWQVKSTLNSSSGKKSRALFDYALSRECKEIWARCTSFIWQNELIEVLSKTSFLERISTENPLTINTNTRLIWAVLLLQSNQARYVIGLNTTSIEQITGMSQVAIRRAINWLVAHGVIGIMAKEVNRNKILPDLAPIYKMKGQQSDTKIIKFGISSSEMLSVTFPGIYQLIRASRGLYKFSSRTSTLLTEQQYIYLSKIFKNKRFVIWVHHLCISSVLSLVPVYTSKLNGDNQLSLEENKDIKYQLYDMLTHALFDAQTLPFNNTPKLYQCDKELDLDVYAMQQYLVDALTKDSLFVIQKLSSPWQLFIESVGNKGHIVDYIAKERIRFTPENELNIEGKSANEIVYKVSPLVLTVMVPNVKNYDNCVEFAHEILTVNTQIQHSKVKHVQHLSIINAS